MPAPPLTAERLFDRWFAPLYPRGANLAELRTTDANPAKNPSITAQLDEAAEAFARLAGELLGAPALVLDYSDASVHRLGRLLTRERRDAWLAPGDANMPPPIVRLVTHGALYVGACIVKNHGGVWKARRPLWESLVELTSSAGTGDLAVFHWWLKALSDDEIGKDRLVDRYRTNVEVPTFDAAALAPLAPPDRRLPRLTKVRYDLLYKHLRAHLPELRDVGEDFPSPERFEDYGFQWLDFKLVGEGRMLLLYGAAESGLHLIWMDAGGFVKSAYYPADKFPAPIVEAGVGDKIRVIVSIQNKPVVHEMLWWGV
jgi:hypothetical protein